MGRADLAGEWWGAKSTQKLSIRRLEKNYYEMKSLSRDRHVYQNLHPQKLSLLSLRCTHQLLFAALRTAATVDWTLHRPCTFGCSSLPNFGAPALLLLGRLYTWPHSLVSGFSSISGVPTVNLRRSILRDTAYNWDFHLSGPRTRRPPPKWA